MDLSVLLFLCLLRTFALSTSATHEQIALMKIKASLDPTNQHLFSWNSKTGNHCHYLGISCNEKQQVVTISLAGKQLSGVLSSDLVQLKYLSALYLQYNQLTGVIPIEMYMLTELSELYLDVNSISGKISPKIGNMVSLQVLQLSHNKLSGRIPKEIGLLHKLDTISLQCNELIGEIPTSLGNLRELNRLWLGYNKLTGAIPFSLSDLSKLDILDVSNNNLSGPFSPVLMKLKLGFFFTNNVGLCIQNCTYSGISYNSNAVLGRGETVIPYADKIDLNYNKTRTPNRSKFPKGAIIAGSVTIIVTLTALAFLLVLRYGYQKQGIISSDTNASLSDESQYYYNKDSQTSLVSVEYSKSWDPIFSPEFLKTFRFNLADMESATQYFSDSNFIRRTGFSATYKGILRDGCPVTIRSLSASSCKSDVVAFSEGLKLVTSLRHENLERLRGFCCSMGRGKGECFLVYDFAPNGNLSDYLDLHDQTHPVLDWLTRVSIIIGIARGIGYLHSRHANKPSMIHKNISAEKILLGQRFIPLISESGIPKLLADDAVFSALKASAAMGYLAPEYMITGKFTEKSDIYAFGVIILQVISGSQLLSSVRAIAAAPEPSDILELVDKKIHGDFCEWEAVKLAKISVACTREDPDDRPSMDAVIQELESRDSTTGRRD